MAGQANAGGAQILVPGTFNRTALPDQQADGSKHVCGHDAQQDIAADAEPSLVKHAHIHEQNRGFCEIDGHVCEDVSDVEELFRLPNQKKRSDRFRFGASHCWASQATRKKYRNWTLLSRTCLQHLEFIIVDVVFGTFTQIGITRNCDESLHDKSASLDSPKKGTPISVMFIVDATTGRFQ